jgi:hypothetical protein
VSFSSLYAKLLAVEKVVGKPVPSFVGFCEVVRPGLLLTVERVLLERVFVEGMVGCVTRTRWLRCRTRDLQNLRCPGLKYWAEGDDRFLSWGSPEFCSFRVLDPRSYDRLSALAGV